MIAADYCRQMARYNRWQNKSLYREASLLSDAERRLDRGAFFGSIQNTLGHILWGDTIWMSRFAGWNPPPVSMAESAHYFPDWDDLFARRKEVDQKIAIWASQLEDEALLGDLTWFSPSINAELSKPITTLMVQFFNHQTHHRGQVHAMLTGAGCQPDATDLPFMPEDA